jgi:hypothetical protein
MTIIESIKITQILHNDLRMKNWLILLPPLRGRRKVGATPPIPTFPHKWGRRNKV